MANKGGVRGEGAVGQLLTMAWETGGDPVWRSGARRTAPLSRLDRGRETRVGPARQQGEGRWAAARSKTGDGPKLKKKFPSNFN
jgi:hypothetical protein